MEQQKISFERISLDAVLKEINNSNGKDKVSKLKSNLALTASRGAEEDSLSFIKIVKQNEYTTYLRELHSYTQEDPYFLKLIITQDDQETRLGYVKYFPDLEIPYINPNSFTGSIQMLDTDMEIVTENYFINGVLQPPASNTTAARGIDGCTSTTVIITHNCTNGGNHAPGAQCGSTADPLINDGYYEIKITVFCPGDDPLAEVPEEFIDIAGPGGGGETSVPPNPKSPCDLIIKLNNDVLFKQKMTNLVTATAYNFETLFTANTNPNPASQPLSNFKFLSFNGTINQPQVIYGADARTLKGVMHSHYEGLLSIYSVTDLQDLYLKILNDQVTDDFFSALVTKSGTRYLLTILDRDKLIAFGNKHLSSDQKIRNLSKLCSSKYNIKISNSNDVNEKGFMKMLTQMDIGLNTFKANSSFSDWQKLSYSNNTNTLTSSGCN